jgi:hypothetical protein
MSSGGGYERSFRENLHGLLEVEKRILHEFCGFRGCDPGKCYSRLESLGGCTAGKRRMSFADLRIEFPSLRPKMRDFSTKWNKIYRYGNTGTAVVGSG